MKVCATNWLYRSATARLMAAANRTIVGFTRCGTCNSTTMKTKLMGLQSHQLDLGLRAPPWYKRRISQMSYELRSDDSGGGRSFHERERTWRWALKLPITLKIDCRWDEPKPNPWP